MYMACIGYRSSYAHIHYCIYNVAVAITIILIVIIEWFRALYSEVLGASIEISAAIFRECKYSGTYI